MKADQIFSAVSIFFTVSIFLLAAAVRDSAGLREALHYAGGNCSACVGSVFAD
jgi:peptidoglycan/LPS O-acetylase OafA/YrhL